MKRLLICLPLLSLGCPFFGGQSQVVTVSPVPASPPASSAPVVSAAPASRPTSQPTALGPPLLLDLSPGTVVERDGVKVTLERFAIQPRTAEALAKEPLDLADYKADEGHYLALQIAVERDGKPFFDMEGEDGELSLGPFALVQGVEVEVFQPGFVEPLGDRADAIYQWRLLQPKVNSKAPLRLRVLLRSDSDQEWEFDFDLEF